MPHLVELHGLVPLRQHHTPSVLTQFYGAGALGVVLYPGDFGRAVAYDPERLCQRGGVVRIALAH